MLDAHTIVAIATPPGRGGVGVVRLSGQKAYAIATQLTGQLLKARTIQVCELKNTAHEILDSAIVLFFKTPHSFTGEDVVEFQCHGSPIVLDQVVKTCIVLGAQLAQPGEFSLRAFLNGKIDLVQAEAIADLIHATSDSAARMAIKSLQGEFSKQVQALNSAIVALRVFIEATLDFSDEEIDVLNADDIQEKLTLILAQLDKLHSQAKQGSLMREGISVVIAGPPNAGKSTLMNQLAGRDVAIVTEIAGTTRDLMREAILMDEIPLLLIDTAGLRSTTCPVEQEGIKRAWQAIQEADCVLLVSDVTKPSEKAVLDADIAAVVSKTVPVLQVFNKIDSAKAPMHQAKQGIYLAAKTGEGLPVLRQAIQEAVGYQPTEGIFIARRRHLDALDRTHIALQNAKKQVQQGCAWELLAEDLRLAHVALTEITGEFSSDDLLGEIFSTFCIGK